MVHQDLLIGAHWQSYRCRWGRPAMAVDVVGTETMKLADLVHSCLLTTRRRRLGSWSSALVASVCQALLLLTCLYPEFRLLLTDCQPASSLIKVGGIIMKRPTR